jgi:hypothetical protein
VFFTGRRESSENNRCANRNSRLSSISICEKIIISPESSIRGTMTVAVSNLYPEKAGVSPVIKLRNIHTKQYNNIRKSASKTNLQERNHLLSLSTNFTSTSTYTMVTMDSLHQNHIHPAQKFDPTLSSSSAAGSVLSSPLSTSSSSSPPGTGPATLYEEAQSSSTSINHKTLSHSPSQHYYFGTTQRKQQQVWSFGSGAMLLFFISIISLSTSPASCIPLGKQEPISSTNTHHKNILTNSEFKLTSHSDTESHLMPKRSTRMDQDEDDLSGDNGHNFVLQPQGQLYFPSVLQSNELAGTGMNSLDRLNTASSSMDQSTEQEGRRVGGGGEGDAENGFIRMGGGDQEKVVANSPTSNRFVSFPASLRQVNKNEILQVRIIQLLFTTSTLYSPLIFWCASKRRCSIMFNSTKLFRKAYSSNLSIMYSCRMRGTLLHKKSHFLLYLSTNTHQ